MVLARDFDRLTDEIAAHGIGLSDEETMARDKKRAPSFLDSIGSIRYMDSGQRTTAHVRHRQ